MEQFNLEKWNQDKSRKVVTRLKKSVQIISDEGKEDIPIVALVEGIAHQYKPNGYHADVVVAYSNQCRDMGDYDLFFADEELTEFEKELVDLVSGWCDSHIETPEEYINKHSQTLLDLARKEILKDLPKWKKATEHLRGEGFIHYDKHNMTPQYADTNVEGGEYYLTLDDLKTLPKEE